MIIENIYLHFGMSYMDINMVLSFQIRKLITLLLLLEVKFFSFCLQFFFPSGFVCLLFISQQNTVYIHYTTDQDNFTVEMGCVQQSPALRLWPNCHHLTKY